MKKRLNAVQKRQLRAYFEGAKKAEQAVIPALERKYRLATMRRFWVALYAAFGLGLALGAALYEAWLQAGL